VTTPNTATAVTFDQQVLRKLHMEVKVPCQIRTWIEVFKLIWCSVSFERKEYPLRR